MVHVFESDLRLFYVLCECLDERHSHDYSPSFLIEEKIFIEKVKKYWKIDEIENIGSFIKNEQTTIFLRYHENEKLIEINMTESVFDYFMCNYNDPEVMKMLDLKEDEK